LASTWKAEKLDLEAMLKKLQDELAFTKTNLERFPDLCLFEIGCQTDARIDLICCMHRLWIRKWFLALPA